MEKKLCVCGTCGKVSIDIRKSVKAPLFTPLASEIEIIESKDMVGETIYLCPQCKDENFKSIKTDNDLVMARANYLTQEEKRKKLKEEESNDDIRNIGSRPKPKSPFSGI